MSVTIYGASDDLVEIDGDIREEFNPKDDTTSYLAFSDGSVVSAFYGNDGSWHLRRVIAGTAKCELVQSEIGEERQRDDEFKTPTYSDVVVLDGDVRWVVFGDRLEPSRGVTEQAPA